MNKEEKDKIIDEALYLVKDAISKGVSKYRIANDTTINESTIGNYANDKTKPSFANAKILIEYFNSFKIMDNGEAISVKNSFIEKMKGGKEMVHENELLPPDVSYKLVPVVHIDSVGGLHSNNTVSLSEPQYVEGYVPFMNAREGDKAIFQTGTSMIPTCPPGSLMQIREVHDWREYFGFGNIFVIELSDGRRITKEIHKCNSNPKDYVICHSHNIDVADEELPKSMIVSVWKVIKILTDKGW